jgi:hypothetical protein
MREKHKPGPITACLISNIRSIISLKYEEWSPKETQVVRQPIDKGGSHRQMQDDWLARGKSAALVSDIR